MQDENIEYVIVDKLHPMYGQVINVSNFNDYYQDGQALATSRAGKAAIKAYNNKKQIDIENKEKLANAKSRYHILLLQLIEKISDNPNAGFRYCFESHAVLFTDDYYSGERYQIDHTNLLDYSIINLYENMQWLDSLIDTKITQLNLEADLARKKAARKAELLASLSEEDKQILGIKS